MSSVKHLIVSNGERILVEAKNHNMNGDFVSILTRILQNSKSTPRIDNFAIIKMHAHIFTIYELKKISFICMCDEEYGEEMSKVFLRNLGDKFFATYPNLDDVDFVTFQKFSSTALGLMQAFSRNDGTQDKLASAEKAIEGVTHVVKQNINLAVRSEENLLDLQNHASSLESHAVRFSGVSTTLERRLCWNSVKLKLFLILLVIFVLYCIAASFCGLSLKAC